MSHATRLLLLLCKVRVRSGLEGPLSGRCHPGAEPALERPHPGESGKTTPSRDWWERWGRRGWAASPVLSVFTCVGA